MHVDWIFGGGCSNDLVYYDSKLFEVSIWLFKDRDAHLYLPVGSLRRGHFCVMLVLVSILSVRNGIFHGSGTASMKTDW